jgi:DNA-binding response OmpR family regulator
MNPIHAPVVPSRLPLWSRPADDGGEGVARPGSQGATRRSALRGKRILLVEDEAMLAFELQYALEETGAEVLGPALTFAEALAMFESHEEIDGAVLDVNLAGQSVIPLAVDLARKGVPLMFNTGHADAAELRAIFPGAEVLAKPTEPDVLADRLARLIGRPRPN